MDFEFDRPAAASSADLEPHIDREFGDLLGAQGFKPAGRHRWVRSLKKPLREIVQLTLLKGRVYSPVWGISSGFAPSFQRSFRRQSTDKNAIMDLIFDPIDETGNVPSHTFHLMPNQGLEETVACIRACAAHFVPLALADFNRVHSAKDFCRFFLERSRLKYRRFEFEMYVQHKLAFGFALIVMGQRAEGLERVHAFCRSNSANPEDRVLLDYIRQAEILSSNT